MRGNRVSTPASKISRFETGGYALDAARRSLSIATSGLQALEAQFQEPEFSATFLRAINRIMKMRGRLIVTGIGKSGIVARKMTATLTSTGAPAIWRTPAMVILAWLRPTIWC